MNSRTKLYFWTMEQVGEQELLALIRNSDYAAFEELHHRYYQPLYKLALKKIGDPDDAYDLMQDMFIELWNKRESFSINNPLYNYLKNRLWFKISGYFRTKGFRDKHFKNFEEFIRQEQDIAIQPDAMELLEMNMQYEAVMEVINRTINDMPAKMKEVFLMSRSREYSVREISEKLEISPKTVKNQINSALNRIRQATSDPYLTTTQLLILIWLTI